MEKTIMATVAALSLLLVAALPIALGQQASLKIVTPEDREVVSNNITVTWEFKKAGDADHIHLYLDGLYQGPQLGSSAELNGLARGSHTIRVIAATKSHQEIGPEATVNVTMKGSDE